MSTRTYLSIGDVLTLLREEFPDVTISKIRFLESQGLVNPERSPSGYRKFFEHDVERLRWVLRQQREHFLPLKVIRDRLAEGNLEEGPEAGSPEAAPAEETTAPAPKAATNGRVAEPARAGVGGGNGVGRHAASTGSGTVGTASGPPRDDEQLTKADSEAMARILADASRRTAQLPEPARPPLPRGGRCAGTAGRRWASSGRGGLAQRIGVSCRRTRRGRCGRYAAAARATPPARRAGPSAMPPMRLRPRPPVRPPRIPQPRRRAAQGSQVPRPRHRPRPRRRHQRPPHLAPRHRAPRREVPVARPPAW